MFGKKEKKLKHYNPDKILSIPATYRIIIGERSNGKTFAIQLEYVKDFFKRGKQIAIIRRRKEDFVGKNGGAYWKNLVCDAYGKNHIEELSNGEYNDVVYYSSRWYMARKDDGTVKKADEPFAYAFALTMVEHDKSSSYPNIGNVLFDEFIAMTGYIPDEFKIFMNTISTIVRDKGPEDIRITMIGNTVSPYCPYFREMGLGHIKSQKPGTIDEYTYSDPRLKVLVEYCSPLNREGKPSDVFFAFDNPKLKMITGGYWEMNIYPHQPYKDIKPKEIVFTFFIEFDSELLQCEVINHDSNDYLYIHRKTTPLKDVDSDLIYSQKYDPRPNWRRNIMKPELKVEKLLANYFVREKVFYQDNEVGETVKAYLDWCKTGGM